MNAFRYSKKGGTNKFYTFSVKFALNFSLILSIFSCYGQTKADSLLSLAQNYYESNKLGLALETYNYMEYNNLMNATAYYGRGNVYERQK